VFLLARAVALVRVWTLWLAWCRVLLPLFLQVCLNCPKLLCLKRFLLVLSVQPL